MENGSLLVDLLTEQNFSILVHGHKHHPRLRYASSGETARLPVFAAGSLAATNTPGLATNTRNLFHIIELIDSPVSGCVRPGTVSSWEFHYGKGWTEPNMVSADFPKFAGFGCLEDRNSIVDRIVEFVGEEGSECLQWSAVELAIPQLRYLTPKEFKAVGSILESDHGLLASPRPPDIPEILGKPHVQN